MWATGAHGDGGQHDLSRGIRGEAREVKEDEFAKQGRMGVAMTLDLVSLRVHPHLPR